MGTGVENPICCDKSMKKAGSTYEKGEGWRDRYRCTLCGSIKMAKIGVPRTLAS